MWKCKECRIIQTLLQKGNKAGWLILPGIKVCSNATVNKTVGYWHKGWHKYKHFKIKLHYFPFSLRFSLSSPLPSSFLLSTGIPQSEGHFDELSGPKCIEEGSIIFFSLKFCPKISKFYFKKQVLQNTMLISCILFFFSDGAYL